MRFEDDDDNEEEDDNESDAADLDDCCAHMPGVAALPYRRRFCRRLISRTARPETTCATTGSATSSGSVVGVWYISRASSRADSDAGTDLLSSGTTEVVVRCRDVNTVIAYVLYFCIRVTIGNDRSFLSKKGVPLGLVFYILLHL